MSFEPENDSSKLVTLTEEKTDLSNIPNLLLVNEDVMGPFKVRN